MSFSILPPLFEEHCIFLPLDIGTAQKRFWRTVSVISYHLLFPLPFSPPARLGGSWWSGSWGRNKAVVSTLLRSSVLLLLTSTGVHWHLQRRSEQLQIESALGFMRLCTKQEAWHCQSNSHAPVHKKRFWGQAEKQAQNPYFGVLEIRKYTLKIPLEMYSFHLIILCQPIMTSSNAFPILLIVAVGNICSCLTFAIATTLMYVYNSLYSHLFFWDWWSNSWKCSLIK